MEDENCCFDIGSIMETHRVEQIKLMDPLFGMMFGDSDCLQILFCLEGSQENQIQILMDFYEKNEIPKLKPEGLDDCIWMLLNQDDGLNTESFHMARVAAILSYVLTHESERLFECNDLSNSLLAYGQSSMMLGASLALGATHMRSDSISSNAKRLSAARHVENHAMKADVFAWLDSQTKFKSIEAAAMAITKQQPIAHVTGRDWYKEWKKLRSASTP